MGFVIALLLALTVALAIWRLGRVDRIAMQLVGACLCLALAGYGWQGRPSLAEQPPLVAPGANLADGEFARTREAVLGRFDRASHWLIMAGGYQARGDTENAVGLIRSGIRSNPRDSDLWTGLGYALVMHADGMMSPAAELAFQRADALAPDHQGPKFYRALALAQGGRFAEAETIWRNLLATAPPDAEWRSLVVERLALLERIRTSMRLNGEGPHRTDPRSPPPAAQ